MGSPVAVAVGFVDGGDETAGTRDGGWATADESGSTAGSGTTFNPGDEGRGDAATAAGASAAAASGPVGAEARVRRSATTAPVTTRTTATAATALRARLGRDG